MGLFILAIVVLFVVFPVPMLLVSLTGFVLWAFVGILAEFGKVLSKLFPEPVKNTADPWEVACQRLSISEGIFYLLCFALVVMLAYALTAAAWVYFGPVVAGLTLLVVSGIAFMAYIKAAP